jgi:N-methylhydantoinase A
MTRYRVAMDIGGTFTDAVAYEQQTGRYLAGKASTTPDDLTRGVLASINQVVESLTDIDFAVNGTTQGINAFLQRRGVPVLLLATEGFGDVYHIARGNRARLYDLHYRKPEPLVPRANIVGIAGRLDSTGAERTALDERAIREAAARVRREGFGAVAVAFLFSYVNPDHELRAEAILREELGPEVHITLSHRIAREWREYERTSSAVLDAYTGPVVRRYLERLESEMQSRGLAATLHVMQSSGGMVTAASARDLTLRTLLSGPVGGAMGGVALSRLLERPNLICIDMGGTSFDISLIVDGRPDVSNEAELEGFPIMMPVVNIHTIGAGGGSIAYSEAGGLRVGPESAGADPGPACYGRGGTRATVTDANLVLGRVDPDWFAGGTMRLDRGAALEAISVLAQEFAMDAMTLVEGICDVANAKMAQAIRNITVERGIEPRDFSLVAFGGAGPMHAAFLARELEIREVIVPSFPGTFSAWGMLESELRTDTSQSMYVPLAVADTHVLARRFADMATECVDALSREGVSSEAVRTEHAVDARYASQEYTLTVPLRSADEPLQSDFVATLSRRFDDAHLARFGHSNPGAPVELVALRTTALGDLGRPEPTPAPVGEHVDYPFEAREAMFGRKACPTRVVRRDSLCPGAVIQGPAIVVEQTATTVMPPHTSLTVHPLGAMIIDIAKEA